LQALHHATAFLDARLQLAGAIRAPAFEVE
jgi:hypothetical protein